MEHVKKICEEFKVNELLNEIVEARFQQNILLSEHDDSEF